MDTHPELDNLDRSYLTSLVQMELGCPTAKIVDWRRTPLAYDVYHSDRTLMRYSGLALINSETAPWSMILKLLRPPGKGGSALNHSWKREALAYQSGIFDGLCNCLIPARVLSVDEDTKGNIWLWLGELVDIYDRQWPLEQFYRAAFDLGCFNGLYLTERPLPGYSWLVDDWTTLHSEPARIPAALAEISSLAADPAVRQNFPAYTADQMEQLLRDQPAFVATLKSLPPTICHHDASQANLFAHRLKNGEIQTVAIDWEVIGRGVLGADIATLIFGTIRRGLVYAEDLLDLDRTVFAGYLNGLRYNGWNGEADLIRLGYCGAVALRWFQLHGTLRSIVIKDARPQRGTFQETDEQALTQFILLTRYLLSCTDEARLLASRLGLKSVF